MHHQDTTQILMNVGKAQMEIINVLQDLPISSADKVAALSCLFQTLTELHRWNQSSTTRRTVSERLEFAERLNRDGERVNPVQFKAVREFLKREI